MQPSDALQPRASGSAAGFITGAEPTTGRELPSVRVASAAEVSQAIVAARQAQRPWAARGFAARRALLRHLRASILRDADALCEAIVQVSGKTRENAMLGEVWPICEKIRWTLAHGEKVLRSESVGSFPLVHKRARIEYRPRGVVGVIAPWNYPLQNLVGPAVGALMAGNAVVIKASEGVAAFSARARGLFAAALDAAGAPHDLVTVVDGMGDVGAALAEGGCDLVIFTGSVANGRRVMVSCSKTLTPCILELGGKDAMIVCEDADLDRAVELAMTGVYIAAGQNCMAAERIFVARKLYAAFRERVVERSSALRQGDSRERLVDLGAMTTEQQREHVEALIADAKAKGARVLCGGHRVQREGFYVAPTVIEGVTASMRIAQEEVFGPVMVLAPFDSDDEALRLANATSFGLSCTVVTRSGARARRLTSQVRAGSVSVNDFGMTYMVQGLPFGGVKDSGFGRINGRDGLRACCEQVSVLEERLPLPPVRLYPAGKSLYPVARALLRFAYGGFGR